jgi:hypothetical protein
VLGAFVALAGPPDLLVRYADRSEPIELHPRPSQRLYTIVER